MSIWNVTNLSNNLGKINIIERKNWKGYYQKKNKKKWFQYLIESLKLAP